MLSESFRSGDGKHESTELLFDERVLNISLLNWNHMVSASEPRHRGSVSLTGNGVFTIRSGRTFSAIIEFIIMDDWLIENWKDHPFSVGEVKPIQDSSAGEEVFCSVDLRVNELCLDNLVRALLLGSRCFQEGGIGLQVYIRQPSPSDWDKLKGNDRYKEHQNLLVVEKFVAVVEGGKQLMHK